LISHVSNRQEQVPKLRTDHKGTVSSYGLCANDAFTKVARRPSDYESIDTLTAAAKQLLRQLKEVKSQKPTTNAITVGLGREAHPRSGQLTNHILRKFSRRSSRDARTGETRTRGTRTRHARAGHTRARGLSATQPRVCGRPDSDRAVAVGAWNREF
jgi:hypothetical protein